MRFSIACGSGAVHDPQVQSPARRAEGLAGGLVVVAGLLPHELQYPTEPKSTPPAGAEPIRWRLLTTHRVETLAQAQQICQCYRQRWHLEQVFRFLKRDGLDLEASELESGEGLQRLGVLALGAALDVLRLLMAKRSEDDGPETASEEPPGSRTGLEEPLEEPSAPLESVFDEGEQACLTALNAALAGRTAKQQNPHPEGTLARAAWTIARLGGWSGYRSQRPAGPATYHRGLQRFYAINDGWHLALQDLYKP